LRLETEREHDFRDTRLFQELQMAFEQRHALELQQTFRKLFSSGLLKAQAEACRENDGAHAQTFLGKKKRSIGDFDSRDAQGAPALPATFAEMQIQKAWQAE